MQKIKPTLYLSFDIETDGDNPMLNNMISIGFVGMNESMTEIFEFSANILEIEGHQQNPQTMKFWEENKLAWNATQLNKRHYVEVMKDLSTHFTELSKMYVLKFIAMPSCFDWMFFKSYYEMARNIIPTMYDIGYMCICISSYFSSYCELQKISGQNKEKLKLNLMEYNQNLDHYAIEDARSQAKLFIKTKQIVKATLGFDDV